jgi:hypothetical protein
LPARSSNHGIHGRFKDGEELCYAGDIPQQAARARLRQRMKARESAQARCTVSASTDLLTGGNPSTSGASTSRVAEKRPSTDSAGKRGEHAEEDYAGGWFGWIWDDLVDMHPFWPHPLLALSELVCGGAVLLFFQSCLGGPFFRCASVCPCMCLQAFSFAFVVIVNSNTCAPIIRAAQQVPDGKLHLEVHRSFLVFFQLFFSFLFCVWFPFGSCILKRVESSALHD